MLEVKSGWFSPLFGIFWVCSLLLIPSVQALESDQFDVDDPLLDMELESLMDLSFNSLSKHEEKVSKAAAAVFVLTANDIERAGVTNVIEAFRLIPGLNVARINSTTSQVSIRGFNNTFSSSLLVLVDGRSIFSPLYSGVFWEQHQIPLSIIDRIEVVRGPGGAIWGSNAVNGVINIITKSSQLDQGFKATTYVGNQEQLIDLKYGDALGNDDSLLTGTWRGYVNYHHYDEWTDWPDTAAETARVGLRWDGLLANGIDWSVMFDNYYTDTQQIHRLFDSENNVDISEVGVDVDGYVLNTAINRRVDNNGEWSFQFYSEYYIRDLLPQSYVKQSINDVSYQYRFKSGFSSLTLGASYRGYHDDYDATDTFYANPSEEYNYFYSVFFQERLSFFRDEMELTFGTKYEHHRFQGGYNQPTLRYAWQFTQSNTVWTAFSKATQAAGRWQRGVHWRIAYDPVFDPLLYGVDIPGLPVAEGFHEINGEYEKGSLVETKLYSWEAGFRSQLTSALYFDLSGYYNEYDDLYLIPPIDLDFVDFEYYWVTQYFEESGEGRSEGVDLLLTYRQAEMDWRVSVSYFELDLWAKDGFEFDLNVGQSDIDPRWQFTLENNWRFLPKWNLNTFVRFMDRAPFFDVFKPVPSYTTVDLKLRHQLTPDLTLYMVGKNIFDAEHVEGRIIGGSPRVEEKVPRSWLVGASLSW